MAEHEVMIDEEAIAANIDRLAGGAIEGGTVPMNGEMVLAEPTESEWQEITKMAAGFLAYKIAPNWEVPPDVQAQWAEALAGCLDQLFPGGLGNIKNWGPWAQFAYASVMVAMCGFDFTTMRFKPLYPVNEDEEEEPVNEDMKPEEVTQAVNNEPHVMG